MCRQLFYIYTDCAPIFILRNHQKRLYQAFNKKYTPITWFYLCVLCFKALEEVVKYFICKETIIFLELTTGKGLLCLKIKMLQIRSLNALINDTCFKIQSLSNDDKTAKLSKISICYKNRCIYIILEFTIWSLIAYIKRKQNKLAWPRSKYNSKRSICELLHISLIFKNLSARFGFKSVTKEMGVPLPKPMDFHQIFRIYIPQEDLERIRLRGYQVITVAMATLERSLVLKVCAYYIV